MGGALTKQLKELSFIINELSEKGRSINSNNGEESYIDTPRGCSHFNQPEHFANQCPSNPHINSRCSKLGKFRHEVSTC